MHRRQIFSCALSSLSFSSRRNATTMAPGSNSSSRKKNEKTERRRETTTTTSTTQEGAAASQQQQAQREKFEEETKEDIRRRLMEEDEFLDISRLHRMARRGIALQWELKRIKECLLYGQHQHWLCELPAPSGTVATKRRKLIARGGSPFFRLLFTGTMTHPLDVKQQGEDANGEGKGSTAKKSALVIHLNDDGTHKLCPHAKLYQVPCGSRLNLIPKRNLNFATWNVMWNFYNASNLALQSLLLSPITGYVTTQRIGGALAAFPRGVLNAVIFLFLGFVVSPCVHWPWGLWNHIQGTRNIFTSDKTFEALIGKYIDASVEENRTLFHQKVFERQFDDMIHIGRIEFSALRTHETFKKQFRRLKKRLKLGDELDTEEDLYDVLGIKSSATQKQISERYRKLAKIFHPDVNKSPHAAEEFQKIQKAYQTLSDAQKRKNYDRTGSASLNSFAKKGGDAVGGTAGGETWLRGLPDDVLQRVFGGRPFEKNHVGKLLRSKFHLQTQSQCMVTLHELECLQTIRVRMLSVQLAKILDVHAFDGNGAEDAYRDDPSGRKLHTKSSSAKATTTFSTSRKNIFQRKSKKSSYEPNANIDRADEDCILFDAEEADDEDVHDAINDDGDANNNNLGPVKYDDFSQDFLQRTERYLQRLEKCSFGKEMLYEVGECYEINAKRYLGLCPMYAPKFLTSRKLMTGLSRLNKAYKDVGQKSKPKEVHAVNFFSVEWDNVVCDLHLLCRFATMIAVNDRSWGDYNKPGSIAYVRRQRRLHALLYLGRAMKEKGRPFKDGTGTELLVHMQTHANTDVNVKDPPAF